jgi:SAM-dependent methyltransferase
VRREAIATKARVQAFWEEFPCGSAHADAREGSEDYFAQVERKRSELEPFIARYADFRAARGQRLLEIGVGLGTDFTRFVRAGADATGVDLSEHAAQLVRRRLELEGLHAKVQVADAEQLPFPDGCFDRVYSWGVLHHTPNTEIAVREAIRVLRPGGTLRVMLYARHSWVAYALWIRYALLSGRPWRSIGYVIAHHMESPGTKAFTRAELRGMFGSLSDLQIEQVTTAYDRRVAGWLAGRTGRWLGWFTVVRGRRVT